MKTNPTIADHYDTSRVIAPDANAELEWLTWREFAGNNPDDWTGDEFTVEDFSAYIASL